MLAARLNNEGLASNNLCLVITGTRKGQVINTYRLYSTTDGPSNPVSYGGPFLAGVLFEVTQGGVWFTGYWWWVCPSGQSTAAQKFALWNITGGGLGTLISDSVVTSGTLTAGQWNYVPMAAPIPLSVGTTYNACTGFTGSFPNTNNAFGSGQPYGGGITQRPLTAFSAQNGTVNEPYGNQQGVFGVAGTDPSVYMPFTGSGTDNFWMDVQVSDTAPSGYSGSYRLWPTKVDADWVTWADTTVNYVVATEIHLSEPCALNKLWYYSPSGTAQLATACDVWDISSQTSVAGSTSPAWSGAAASGWVSCSFTGVTLPAGGYRVSVYNGAASPDGWNAKRLNYWDTGPGQNGITNGPVSAPKLSGASTAWEYDGSAGGPRWTNGIQEPGQSTFAIGPPNQYPYLYVDGLAQNYWIDMEVAPASGTPVTSSPPSSPQPTSPPRNSSGFLSFFP